MNRLKVRQRYIDLHGHERHYLEMIEKRNKEFADKMAKEMGLSKEQAQAMLDEFDRLDEELDIEM